MDPRFDGRRGGQPVVRVNMPQSDLEVVKAYPKLMARVDEHTNPVHHLESSSAPTAGERGQRLKSSTC